MVIQVPALCRYLYHVIMLGHGRGGFLHRLHRGVRDLGGDDHAFHESRVAAAPQLAQVLQVFLEIGINGFGYHRTETLHVHLRVVALLGKLLLDERLPEVFEINLSGIGKGFEVANGGDSLLIRQGLDAVELLGHPDRDAVFDAHVADQRALHVDEFLAHNEPPPSLGGLNGGV